MANKPPKSRVVKYQTADDLTAPEANGCACLYLNYSDVWGQISSAPSDCRGRKTAQAVALHIYEYKSTRCLRFPSKKLKKREPQYCFSSQPKGMISTSKSVKYRAAFLLFLERHLKSYSIAH